MKRIAPYVCVFFYLSTACFLQDVKMRDTCDIPCHSRGRCISKVFLKVSVATQKSHIDLQHTVINRTSTIRVYVYFRCFPTINAFTQPELRWVIKALCLESYPALLIPSADFYLSSYHTSFLLVRKQKRESSSDCFVKAMRPTNRSR